MVNFELQSRDMYMYVHGRPAQDQMLISRPALPVADTGGGNLNTDAFHWWQKLLWKSDKEKLHPSQE